MFKYIFTSIFALSAYSASAQYAIQAPLAGHEGIRSNDPRFVDWASGCSVQRGWLDIADKGLGQPTLGSIEDALGRPSSSILSLGDSGVAVLTFDYPITNGPGPDFAVFENGFSDLLNDTMAFLELAFVEVSSDGTNFFRFPAYSNMQDTAQIDNFTYSDARYYHNLAGKYKVGYGTPFDLEDLAGTEGLDIDRITHVRIVDVIGSIDPSLGSFDHNGHVINEPYPTTYPSAGFDLNAVGVLNSLKPVYVNEWDATSSLKCYPNPVKTRLFLEYRSEAPVSFKLMDITGRQMKDGHFANQTDLDMSAFPNGAYYIQLTSLSGTKTIKFIKQ